MTTQDVQGEEIDAVERRALWLLRAAMGCLVVYAALRASLFLDLGISRWAVYAAAAGAVLGGSARVVARDDSPLRGPALVVAGVALFFVVFHVL